MTALLPRYLLLPLMLVLFFQVRLQAQNLVPNPGFETQTSCPAVSEIQKAPPWNSPSAGTPDLFNSTCPSQNFPGRTGIGCSGIFCYSVFPNSREYIQARLTQPLIAGQNYCVSFYVQRDNFMYSISTIGAYFSTDSVYLLQTDPLPYTPQVESPSATQITSTGWTEVSGSFTASGGESFIIIGNFHNDATTSKAVAQSSPDSVAYYRIDDISVTACSASGINDVALNPMIVYPNPATDALNIELATGSEEIKSVVLYDLLSSRINIQPQYENGNHKAVFNTGQLPAGIYLAVVNTENTRMVKKVSVAK